MCALFGFLDYKHQVSARVLQKLLQALANASEVRGTHASGIAYNKGGQPDHLQASQACTQDAFQAPARDFCRHGTRPVYHAGKPETELQQSSVPGSRRNGFCPCPQWGSVQ